MTSPNMGASEMHPRRRVPWYRDRLVVLVTWSLCVSVGALAGTALAALR